ncbi:DUF2515 family protein [Virgibacillus sp. C22-A2]|uniref:DUF2515 family protein n=1 Tax=Virgibacillus tibetensis TaxID=3042313 RepID=A0ABU6KBI5_9BACI|nr:DUF2515 family protein [Virgibacillus sp. C22-A2]
MRHELKKQPNYVHYITNLTRTHNVDNISRTKAYQNFYIQYPEVKWALVASIVSRNAGWNMTDLHLSPFQKILSNIERERLFMTYERANWLIFSDAYPQLLVYKLSCSIRKPMFHLLKAFDVSNYMIQEWYRFWRSNDKDNLMTALIINEQNVIQKPVITQSFFKKHVFQKLPYLLQDYLLMNAVIIPTSSANLYGTYVHDFTNITNRIMLGKLIASLIFSPELYYRSLDFALAVEHTGSRSDYEQYTNRTFPNSPMLRVLYPVINHQDKVRNDWYKSGGIRRIWLQKHTINVENYAIEKSFYQKRNMLYAYYYIRNIFS